MMAGCGSCVAMRQCQCCILARAACPTAQGVCTNSRQYTHVHVARSSHRMCVHTCAYMHKDRMCVHTCAYMHKDPTYARQPPCTCIWRGDRVGGRGGAAVGAGHGADLAVRVNGDVGEGEKHVAPLALRGVAQRSSKGGRGGGGGASGTATGGPANCTCMARRFSFHACHNMLRRCRATNRARSPRRPAFCATQVAGRWAWGQLSHGPELPTQGEGTVASTAQRWGTASGPRPGWDFILSK